MFVIVAHEKYLNIKYFKVCTLSKESKIHLQLKQTEQEAINIYYRIKKEHFPYISWEFLFKIHLKRSNPRKGSGSWDVYRPPALGYSYFVC